MSLDYYETRPGAPGNPTAILVLVSLLFYFYDIMFLAANSVGHLLKELAAVCIWNARKRDAVFIGVGFVKLNGQGTVWQAIGSDNGVEEPNVTIYNTYC